MSRVEENNRIMAYLNDEKMEKPNGTFEEMTVWNFGTVATLLADISKSLAIIADSMSREDGEQNDNE